MFGGAAGELRAARSKVGALTSQLQGPQPAVIPPSTLEAVFVAERR